MSEMLNKGAWDNESFYTIEESQLAHVIWSEVCVLVNAADGKAVYEMLRKLQEVITDRHTKASPEITNAVENIAIEIHKHIPNIDVDSATEYISNYLERIVIFYKGNLPPSNLPDTYGEI